MPHHKSHRVAQPHTPIHLPEHQTPQHSAVHRHRRNRSRYQLSHKLVGSGVTSTIAANLIANLHGGSTNSNLYISGGLMALNIIGSFIDKSSPTMAHVSHRVSHAAAGWLVMLGGTLEANHLMESKDEDWKLYGRLLLTASWAAGSCLVHLLSHYQEDGAEDEEREPLLQNHLTDDEII